MDENETTVEDTNEVEDLTALDDVEETDTPDWEAIAKKNAGIAKRALTKLAKANQVVKPEEKAPVATQEAKKIGELDETQLDYLDVKGISDADEIAVIQAVVAKTGQTVRQALKDDYVVAKLDALRAEKAVADATPSSNKRSGSQQTDLASAIAKFERTQELPDDFALRSAVVNALVDKSSTTKPPWQR